MPACWILICVLENACDSPRLTFRCEMHARGVFPNRGLLPSCWMFCVLESACDSPRHFDCPKCTQEACFLTGGSMPACWILICVLGALLSPQIEVSKHALIKRVSITDMHGQGAYGMVGS